MQRERRDLGAILPDLFTRPDPNFDKKGKAGRPVEVSTNFVKINVNESGQIHQYHVSFEPDIDSKKCRFDILHSPAIEREIGKHFMFDGMILYLYNIEWKARHEIEASNPNSGEPVLVVFRLAKTFGRRDPQVINLYNLLIRRSLDAIGYKQLGRNYFNPSGEALVEKYGLAVWPGFETAIRVYEEGLMLCAEARFKMLRLHSVFDIMKTEYERTRADIPRMQRSVEELLIGQTVVTRHNYKMYRVTRIEWDKSPLTKIRQRDGAEITLQSFYASQHGINLKEERQPLIVSEGKPFQPGEEPQVFYLMPEICYPTGLTDTMRNDSRVMRELSQYTRLSPESRRSHTMDLLREMRNSVKCQEIFRYWDISFGTDLFSRTTRVLNEQELFGAGQRSFRSSKGEWARDCKSSGVYRTGSLRKWMLVAPHKESSIAIANQFVEEMKRICQMLSIELSAPSCVVADDPSPQGYATAINGAISSDDSTSPFGMIVVLLADDNKTRYDSIKKLLCTTDARAIPSQCIKQQTLGKPGGVNKNFGSIVLKIALQMNCKVGGALWRVNIPLKRTMIVGYDLYHDSTNRGKTIGACVATTSDDFTEFYSQTRPHSDPTELGTNLEFFIKRALRKYYDANGALPDQVLIYRDGAGDGQIPFIKSKEVEQVRNAFSYVCGKVDPSHEIKFSFTIVTKKVNMRVFGKSPNGRLDNPPLGTVVDDGVTRPERWDFYLVPQAVNQGTVSPVCYNIIENTTDLTPDHQQLLAFKLCHMYYNWQGTIRVPAPCQYAHKLAFLVAQSLHEDAKEPLKNKLYFL